MGNLHTGSYLTTERSQVSRAWVALGKPLLAEGLNLPALGNKLNEDVFWDLSGDRKGAGQPPSALLQVDITTECNTHQPSTSAEKTPGGMELSFFGFSEIS